MLKYFPLFACTILISCTGISQDQTKDTLAVIRPANLSDSALFRLVQQQTFQYFWNGAEPVSGMARERYHVDGEYPSNDKNVVTTGGGGFGVMAILVGIERGFITRLQGLERLHRIVNFFGNGRSLSWCMVTLVVR